MRFEVLPHVRREAPLRPAPYLAIEEPTFTPCSFPFLRGVVQPLPVATGPTPVTLHDLLEEVRPKQFRYIVTRYEKTAESYRAMLTLAAILLWL